MIPLWLRLWSFNGHYAKQTGEMESNILAIGCIYININIYIYIYIIWHSIWQSSWHRSTDIPSGILSCILLGILSDIYILTFYLVSIWRIFWHSIWHCVAFYLTSGARCWGPAVPTDICPSRLRRRRRRRAACSPGRWGSIERIRSGSLHHHVQMLHEILEYVPTFAQKTTHWLLYWHVTACKRHPISQG